MPCISHFRKTPKYLQKITGWNSLLYKTEADVSVLSPKVLQWKHGVHAKVSDASITCKSFFQATDVL